jgi:hypothetical protein
VEGTVFKDMDDFKVYGALNTKLLEETFRAEAGASRPVYAGMPACLHFLMCACVGRVGGRGFVCVHVTCSAVRWQSATRCGLMQ